MPSNTQTLYLTFDDGPVPGPTEFVLETLYRAGVKATFFCIGDNIRKHPDIFASVCRYGHAIGNHTYHHVNGWKTNTVDYEKNVKRCRDEIDAHTRYGNSFDSDSHRDSLFRPPFGRISRDQIKRLLPEYKIIMWDVLSVDYNQNLSAEKCLRNTIAATRAGSIIVFHDSYKAEKNLMYALPRFVEHYLGKGFGFDILGGREKLIVNS
jgi:peptidoglycan/xylan/chitin deacetylase (PgdA/CDA1 family)